MLKSLLIALSLSLPAAALAGGDAPPLSLKTITVMKISAQDELATVRTPDGALHLLRAGDDLGKGARVTEIGKGKVVVQETTDKGVETVFLILDKGVQKIERIRSAPEERKRLNATGTMSVSAPAQPVQSVQ